MPEGGDGDRALMFASEIRGRLVTLMGGRAAEMLTCAQVPANHSLNPLHMLPCNQVWAHAWWERHAVVQATDALGNSARAKIALVL